MKPIKCIIYHVRINMPNVPKSAERSDKARYIITLRLSRNFIPTPFSSPLNFLSYYTNVNGPRTEQVVGISISLLHFTCPLITHLPTLRIKTALSANPVASNAIGPFPSAENVRRGTLSAQDTGFISVGARVWPVEVN